jgi:hypothetical protein
MGGVSTSDWPGGLLWRIARLHPGLLWVLCFALGLSGSIILNNPLVDVDAELPIIFGSLFFLLWSGYPLFAIFLLSRIFPSSAPKRLKRAIAAFAFVGLWIAAVAPVSYMARSNAGDLPPGLKLVLDITAVPLFAAMFYLWIAASVALIQAEKGSAYSGRHVFGNFLLFFYLPFFGIFFLHRRMRRLVRDQENPNSRGQQLPMERLDLAPMKSGHLCLVLSEFPNWVSFERYAEELLHRLDGQVVRKGSGVDMHIWSVEIESVPLQMVYEDFPNRVCLESDSEPGDKLLRQLRRRLATPASV